MKKIKKLGVAAVVLAMCALLGITVWAAEGIDATAYSYTVVVEAGKSEMCVSDQAREVTVTVMADKAYAINSLDATVTVSGCTVKSVTMPVAAETDWTDYNATTGHFGWVGLDSLNKTTQDLLTIVIEIPAGAEAGDYTVTVTDVMLTQLTGEENDHAMTTLTGKTISSYVTVKVKAHKFEAQSYNWSLDGSSCTAVGKCACGADATATATIESKVTKNPTCKDDGMGVTTYTATFNATWAEKQTLTLTNIPKLEHTYTGGIRNDGNSKDGTHSFMCVNGCQQYGGAVAHTWDEGKETTAPGCTTTGVMTYTCKQKDCGATYTEEIPAHGHSFGETVAANDATCTAPGNEAYKQCDACKKFFAADAATDSTDGKDSADAFVIAAAGHSFGETVAANDATCMAPGNEAYKQCETCGKFFAADAANDSAAGEDSADAFAIAIDENAHDFATEISGYTDNGDGTHTPYYTCAHNSEHKLDGEAVEHTYDQADDKCVCGAEKPAPAGVKGDVNGDGLVNSGDLTVLARHVGGIELITDEAALANADVNGDGEINSADLTKHARYVGGIITDWSQE